MRSIEGRMRGGIKTEYARCAGCKDKIVPGIRVRALIEKQPGEEQPAIVLMHPSCLKRYLARHPDSADRRDDEGAIPDFVVRKFWVGLDVKKGWGGFIDRVLPLC